MKSSYFCSIFALVGAAVLVGAPGYARAQGSATLQLLTHFPGQYDTKNGWRYDYGVDSVHNSVADPTISAGAVEGGTRLLVGAHNSIGNFFNALKGLGDVHNGQEYLPNVFYQHLPAGFVVGEPQVLRDSSSAQLFGAPATLDRYIIAAEATNASTHESRIYISVTKYDEDQVYDQCVFSFDANSPDSSLWAASLHMGTNGNAVLFTANMRSFSDNSFQYAKMWQLPKSSIYNDPTLASCPGPVVPASVILNQPDADGSLPFSVIPARTNDNRPIAYLVNSWINGGNSLRVWELDTTDPTVISGGFAPVSTNSYFAPPKAEQAGTSALVNTSDARLYNAVYQPDSGLWTVNTAACTPDGDTALRACVEYFQIDLDTWTTKQQVLVASDGLYFYAPAIAVNNHGDAVLAFNGSGPNNYIGMYLAGHYHTDAPNTLLAIWHVNAGGGCYETNDGNNTVATHSDATVDPINDSVFWLHSALTYGENASCLSNDWATEIAAVQFVGGSLANETAQSRDAEGTSAERKLLPGIEEFGKGASSFHPGGVNAATFYHASRAKLVHFGK